MKYMKALRLVIHQTSANYKREETVENKMTYPLPPFSTVIGAIHKACGYKEYHEMDISIQGQYESMHREPYTDYCFLNSVQDDRGILVKMRNGEMLSNAFDKVASAKKPQGNSFREGITIQVHNAELLEEYRALKNLNDEISEFKKTRITPLMDLIKKRKKHLSERKKQFDKNTLEYERVVLREKQIKAKEKEIKNALEEYQRQNYTIPISYYRSLTKSMKFYEVLNGITLMIHVKAADEILEDILEHAYDIKSIGRSEDTIFVENAEIVELETEADDEIVSKYAAYIDYDLVKKDCRGQKVFLREKENRPMSGTKYYLNKNYTIRNGQRKFEKKKVLYTSEHVVEEFDNGLYLDWYQDEAYIVNFL